MSEGWDFYLCHVDGKPTSILLDLDLVHEAPAPGLTQLIRVDLTMLAPLPDGLASRVESERLNSIESALRERWPDEARYAGRVTGNGQREFYVYAGTADGWSERIAAAMAGFPEYACQVEVREDPQWKAYLDFLYPDAAGRESISNRRLCEALARSGDALDKPRAIDHWAYFPTEEARSRFVARVAPLGFALQEAWGPDEDTASFAVRIQRTDIPGLDNIDDVTHALLYVATELGGEYDGWECAVLRDEATEPSPATDA